MKHTVVAIALAAALPCAAQDAKTWLEAQNLDALETKAVQDLNMSKRGELDLRTTYLAD